MRNIHEMVTCSWFLLLLFVCFSTRESLRGLEKVFVSIIAIFNAFTLTKYPPYNGEQKEERMASIATYEEDASPLTLDTIFWFQFSCWCFPFSYWFLFIKVVVSCSWTVLAIFSHKTAWTSLASIEPHVQHASNISHGPLHAYSRYNLHPPPPYGCFVLWHEV